MIIPEKFQWNSREEAEAVMKAWIRENFADVLGPRINLIDQPNGLNLLRAEINHRLEAAGLAVEHEEIAAAA